MPLKSKPLKMIGRTFFDPDYKHLRNSANLSHIRLFTSFFRMSPAFIIAGAQKAGTTSLYEYLVRHPQINPAKIKEPDFFDRFVDRGYLWYKAHFALSTFSRVNQKLITGEGSTNYIWHPHVPRRITQLLPNIKIIFLVRDPVERAYSHYQMQIQKQEICQREVLPFQEAVESESSRLHSEMEKMFLDEGYYSYPYRWYGYLAKGVYVEQLKVWARYFSWDQMMVINSKRLFLEPRKTLTEIFQFLEVEMGQFTPKAFIKYNNRRYSKMPVYLEERLRHYFKHSNEELFDFLGVDFGWNDAVNSERRMTHYIR